MRLNGAERASSLTSSHHSGVDVCLVYFQSLSCCCYFFFSVVEMQHVPMFLFIFFFLSLAPLGSLWSPQSRSSCGAAQISAVQISTQRRTHAHFDTRPLPCTRARPSARRAHTLWDVWLAGSDAPLTSCELARRDVRFWASAPSQLLLRPLCPPSPPFPFHPPASTFSLRIACNTKPNLNSLLCSTSQNAVLCVF